MHGTGELLFCVAGVYACFLTWGVLQERVSTTPYYAADDAAAAQPARFTHFVFLNWIQSLSACAVAYIYLRLWRNLTLGDPSLTLVGEYAKVALCSSLASPFGYASLKHIDYLTLILGKSCKLIPVMFMGYVLHRRRFAWFQYVSVGLITLGVTAFMVWQPMNAKGSSSQNSLWGLALLLINLLLDGATNTSQDQIFVRHGVNGPQMMFFMNFFSALIMLSYLVVVTPFLNADGASDFLSAIAFCRTFPAAQFDVIVFGLVGALGQVFIFYTLERFGSLVLVTVNVTRKMFSMLLSVVWFGHQLTLGQWMAVLLVFCGIGLEAQMSKQKRRKDQATASPPPKNIEHKDSVATLKSRLRKRQI